MEQESYYFRVGLFVAIALCAAIVVIGWFGSKNDHSGHTAYTIYFNDSVDGLTQGSPVKLRGIQVGYVDSISFAAAHDDTIRVMVQIINGAPIRVSTIASLQLQGITGGSFIGLDNTGPAQNTAMPKDVDDYPIIASKPSSLERVVSSIPELIDQFTKLAVQGQKMLSDDNIKALNQTLNSASTSMQALGTIFGDKKGQAISGTIEQLNETIDEAKMTLREIKMLARTLREDPSIILRGVQHEGVVVP